MCNIDAYPLPECTGYCIGGVNPAVSIQYILWYVFCVDAVDWIANILPRRHNQGECEQAHDCERVVQPEDGAVDVDMADLHQVLQATKNI